MPIGEILDTYVRYFLKIFEINIFMYFIYIKNSNYKDNNIKKICKFVFINIFISVIYTLMIKFMYPIFAMSIVCAIDGITLMLLLKQKKNYCMFVAILSFIISYLIYFGAVIISGILLSITHSNLSYETAISFINIPILMIVIYKLFFRIRRWKNGFGFLRDVDTIDKLSKIINPVAFTIIIIFGLIQDYEDITYIEVLIGIIIIFTIFFIIWLQSQITKHYKKNMRDRTIEVQKEEIEEHLKFIEEVKEENLKLADVIHRYNNRLSAVEMALKEAINKNINTDFSSELSVILDETKELSKNFAKESEIIKTKLPLTNIAGIDNMFKYMQKEALDNNINFDLKLNDSIHDLIDKIIPKDKFETLLGDHLRDAIIAINCSNNSYRSILVTLGIVENCYELSIYDTGIEFEIETLLKLGKERITTHKDTGGSGIGFMTTFETLKEAKASLVIEEYNPETTSYSKSVNIIFDGKSEYRIYSYRAEEIKKQNKDKRIIIKNI